jgi:hypothetical protein
MQAGSRAGPALGRSNAVDVMGWPMKISEFMRLFAEGFKGGNSMLTTSVAGSADSANKAYATFESNSNNYYIWLPRTAAAAEPVSVDLSGLDVATGTIATVREI